MSSAIPLPAIQAKKYIDMPKDKAIRVITRIRDTSIDPDYWDAVMEHTLDAIEHIENEQRRIDKYYVDALPQHMRDDAHNTIDGMDDLSKAFKEINLQLRVSRKGTPNFIYWSYIRRELNKRRRMGGGNWR